MFDPHFPSSKAKQRNWPYFLLRFLQGLQEIPDNLLLSPLIQTQRYRLPISGTTWRFLRIHGFPDAKNTAWINFTHFKNEDHTRHRPTSPPSPLPSFPSRLLSPLFPSRCPLTVSDRMFYIAREEGARPLTETVGRAGPCLWGRQFCRRVWSCPVSGRLLVQESPRATKSRDTLQMSAREQWQTPYMVGHFVERLQHGLWAAVCANPTWCKHAVASSMCSLFRPTY